MSTPPIRLRPGTETDAPFAFNSWLKCYRHSRLALQMQNEVYFSGHHKVIEGLLKNCSCIVACSPDDLSQIYGYAVGEKRDGQLVVHFIYVKEAYRRLGIGLLLLKSLGYELGQPYFFTQKTHAVEKYEKKYPIIYHPYLAFYAYEQADLPSSAAEHASDEESE
jgi:GNAT superfamily N-acetyltransferase